MTTAAPRRAPVRRFDSPQQEAYLALWRTYDRLRAVEDETFAAFDLTNQQYNLLRLLKAARPDPVPTLKLVDRLISRAPDITRMLDKLEARGLVSRTRGVKDRRAVLVALTDAGADLIRDVARPLAACHARQLGHLTAEQLSTLTELLHAARLPHESADSPWR